jgi:hypothetical protein
MFNRTLFCALLLLTVFYAVIAQTPEKEKPKVVTDDLRKEAVGFLRETSAEVGSLRSLENRISFSSEMAGLMWFYDEKEAGAMYQSVIGDFKQLLGEYDAQMNALGVVPDESYRAGMFGGNMNDQARLSQKFYKAMGVRQQIAMSLAENDPTLAYNFFYDTLNIVSNAEFRKQLEQRDAYFEIRLMKQIALKDPAKAAEFGRRSLAKGINWAHLDLLKKIYEKDADKGAEFAAEIVKKFKSDKITPDGMYNLVAFINAGAENLEKVKKTSGKKPMFSEQNMRDLTEVLAQSILERKDTEKFDFVSYMTLFEKYAPARAVQLRAKFPAQTKTPVTAVKSEESDEPQGLVSNDSLAVKTEAVSETQKKEMEARKEQDEMMKNVQKLGSKELPKEEREKIVAESRKIIGGMGKNADKIMALSLLAGQVSRFGDRELAAEIMKDAQSLVNPAPKNYLDYMEVWFLASAYSETDPEKAFPLLDDAIFRLNDTLSAFIKVGEFMDVSGEIIDDGEVQVGAFGGSMARELIGGLGMASPALRNLAVADFGKTKALTNKFDRAEVRILAKMLVLRAVLGDKAEKPDTELEKDIEEF